MTFAADLLEQAEHLAKREMKRPRQASLRRAVSSAYYALFHLLVSDCTSIVGPNVNDAGSHKMQRWFNHGDMKKVCGMFATCPPAHITAVLGASLSTDLSKVARAFISLQEARHQADYDVSATFSRLTVLQKIQTSKDAFASWAIVKRTHEANIFAIALLSEKLFERERR